MLLFPLLVAQSYLTLCDPMYCKTSSFAMEFPWQEYWNGLPFPPPMDLPNPGIEAVSLMSFALAGGFLTASTTIEAPLFSNNYVQIMIHK